MPIEVGQRRYPGHINTVLLGDERQPQTQLGEAHGCRCEVDTEQRARQDVALYRESRPVSGGASEAHHLVERSQQERARSGRRVEDREPAQVGSGARGNTFVHPPRGSTGRNAEPVGEGGFESCTHHLVNKKGGRVVAPARGPFIGVHHAFEHSAEHVGCDEFSGIMLADREVKSLEQLVERVAPLGVAPDGRAVPPLQHGGLEQTAVEEWDLA